MFKTNKTMLEEMREEIRRRIDEKYQWLVGEPGDTIFDSARYLIHSIIEENNEVSYYHYETLEACAYVLSCEEYENFKNEVLRKNPAIFDNWRYYKPQFDAYGVRCYNKYGKIISEPCNQDFDNGTVSWYAIVCTPQHANLSECVPELPKAGMSKFLLNVRANFNGVPSPTDTTNVWRKWSKRALRAQLEELIGHFTDIEHAPISGNMFNVIYSQSSKSIRNKKTGAWEWRTNPEKAFCDTAFSQVLDAVINDLPIKTDTVTGEVYIASEREEITEEEFVLTPCGI